MKSPRMIILALAALTLGALALANPVMGAPAADPPRQSNLLNNGGFEGGTHMYNNDGDMKLVPDGWTPWWSPPTGTNDCKGNPPAYFVKPHYETETHASHVKEGIASARWFTSSAVHRAGLYQTVAVTAGSIYKFSAYAFGWSSKDGKVDGQSAGPVDLRVGIDPGGGTNGDAGSVVWGNTVATVDQFVPLEVQATATGGSITVFLYARPYWCFLRNDSFWDAASLVLVGAGPTAVPGGGVAQPTQKPSSGVPIGSIIPATEQADGSIIHTVHSGESCIGIAYTYASMLGLDQVKTLEQIYALNNLNNVSCRGIYPGQRIIVRNPTGGSKPPAATEAATDQPASTDSGGGQPQPTQQVAEVRPAIICVMAYDDQNGNNLPEPTEPKAAGLTFSVNNGASTVGTYTTDGVNEPHCFNNLQPGNYAVSWVGDGFTGAEQSWQTAIGEGQTASHNFAVSSGIVGQPPPDGGSVSGPGADSGEGLPLWATALIAAVGVILFLGGLGVAGYFLLMRRRV